MTNSVSPKQDAVKQMRSEQHAYRLGCQDARAGERCLPELYFVRRDQTIAYVRGHEAVAGETMLSRQILQAVAR